MKRKNIKEIEIGLSNGNRDSLSSLNPHKTAYTSVKIVSFPYLQILC
jgi:hypothetical protein